MVANPETRSFAITQDDVAVQHDNNYCNERKYMNKVLLKQLVILSVITGLALGVITLVPFIGKIAFWTEMCLVSVFVIIFLTRSGAMQELPAKESIVTGAVIGFVSFIAFCAVYLPLLAGLSSISNLYINNGIAMALRAGSPGIIIMLVVFVGVLSATLNAFSAFLTFYIAEFLKGINK